MKTRLSFFKNFFILSIILEISMIIYCKITGNFWWSFFGWILILALIIAIYQTWHEYFLDKSNRLKIDLLTCKLKNIVQKKDYNHILLKENDPYFNLAKAINNVQSSQRDLVKEYQIQRRGYFGLLEYLTIGVMVIDRTRHVISANHALNEIFGHDMNQEKIGYYYVFNNLDIIKLMDSVFTTQKDQHQQIEDRDGTGKFLDVQGLYIPLNSGYFLVMCMVTDVTEQKRVEKVQHDFISNVSHELKTPVTSIKGFSETLLQGALEDKDVRRNFIEIIYKESKELQELINDILSLSRLEESKKLNLSDINFYQFVNDAWQSFITVASENNIVFKNEVDKSLNIICDKSKLRHILNNLLQNAIRYNKNYGEVKVKAIEHGDFWKFFVCDTGIGIKEKYKERIFERFYRIDQSRAKDIAGTGLGLSVVFEYVSALSGRIAVKSTIGKGSKFIVTLPQFIKSE